MRVMFVDDEPHILEGIRKALHSERETFDMAFCESAEAALEQLAGGNFDVLVTDIQMPGMDGKALLEAAHERFPKVLRIVLSGRDDWEMDLRKVPIAHHFVIKPCRAEALKAIIARTVDLRDQLHRSELISELGPIDGLPDAPQIYVALTQAMTNPRTTPSELSAIIQQDQTVANRLIEFAASRIHGRGAAPRTLIEAIVSLGFDMVKSASLSFAFFRLAEMTAEVEGATYEAMRRHAERTAEIAPHLAGDPLRAGDCFLAATLHDIGKWMILSQNPERYRETLSYATQRRCTFAEAEQALFAATHAEMGAHLLERWGLTYPIVAAVAHHHSPERIPAAEPLPLAAIVFLANRVANQMSIPEAVRTLWRVGPRVERLYRTPA